jgi:integrase
VPLSAEVLRIWNQVGGGFGLADAQRDAVWRKLRDKAGVVGLHFHDARAEAITRLSRKLDILTLARMVGHKDVRELQTYYRERAEDVAARI